jgi:chitinase
MSRRWTILSVAAALTLAVITPPAAQAHRDPDRDRVVGYFIQWGIYARSFFAKNLVDNGSAARLTTLNYAFGFLDPQGNCVSADPWADYQRPFSAAESVSGQADDPSQALFGNLNQFKQLKAKYPKLRVNISLGGWTGSAYFSNAALTDASRQAHVKSCIDMWLRGDLPGLPPGAAAGVFDGIDLDWEWPASEGNPGNVIRPEDKQNYTKLLREYRTQLDELGKANHKHYDLTAFLPANPATMDRGYEVHKLFKYLDFATTQGYDYHGPWELVTNQQSSLRTPSGDPSEVAFSSQVTIDSLLQRGAPRHRLVMGVPFYSHGWTGVRNQNNGLFQPATAAAPGTFEAGTEDYKVLKANLSSYALHRDNRAGFAWIFDGTTFWTYDDPIEMKRKARYADGRGLGGVMIWSMDGDTSQGELTAALHSGLH